MTDKEQRKGTRCAVCVMCGRCFEDESDDKSSKGAKWSGTRCEVCVSCGKCAEAWGLVKDKDSDADSGPTNWASAFKVMDTGSAGAPPPVNGAPGIAAHDSGKSDSPVSDVSKGSPASDNSDKGQKPSSFACLKRGADGEDPDTSTGATPGVSSACKEYGFDDMDKFISDLGIKPPGVA